MEHLIIALIEDGQGDIPLILKKFGIDAGDVQEKCTKNIDEMESGNPSKPRLSPLLTELLDEAWIVSSVHHNENKIRSGALFEVFIASEQVISSGLMETFSPINQEDLKADFYKIVAGSTEDGLSSMETVPAETAAEIPPDGTVLDVYTTNLTDQATKGKIDPVMGRDDEIIQMVEILSRR
jgi:type VI secretion system protein VasG